MKKSVKKILMSLIVAVGLVASVGLGFFVSVHALSGWVSKGEMSALIECYNKGAFKDTVEGKVFTKADIYGVEKFMEGSQQVHIPIGSRFFKGDVDPPTTKVKCRELVKTLLSNINVPSGPNVTGAEVTGFIVGKMGYQKVAASQDLENKKCFYFSFNYERRQTNKPSEIATTGTLQEKWSNVKHSTVCAEVDGDGKIKKEGEITYKVEVEEKARAPLSEIFDFQVVKSEFNISYLRGSNTKTVSISENEKWSDFVEAVKNAIIDPSIQINDEAGIILKTKCDEEVTGAKIPSSLTEGCIISVQNGYAIYVYKAVFDKEGSLNKNESTAAELPKNMKFTRGNRTLEEINLSLFSLSSVDKPLFMRNEVFSLYKKYLDEFYDVSDPDFSEEKTDELTSNGAEETKACKDGKMQKAWVYAKKHKNDKVGGVAWDGLSSGTFGDEVGWKDMVNWLKDNYSDGDSCPAEESGGGSGGEKKKEDNSGKPEGFVDCNDIKTLGAMQWVLCPTMNNMEYTANWIDNMTQDWLEVKSDLYSDSGNNKISFVWKKIRDVANVLMMVFFIIIIFSQLTGRGIDNYGIKKMLPRFIVMAIVMNLSLYICQIAVDLSNIFGTGLRDLFGSIGTAAAEGESSGPSFMFGMIAGIFAAAAAGGPAAITGFSLATVATVTLAPAIVIAVIVLLLVVLVAIVTLFLMLGAREIIVVVCVIISPLAFAAYLLPNTQNLFKKWWELFKAALIVYPICGALSGISATLRGVWSGEDTELPVWTYVILLILPYLGFFLIPMLLKNAIAALGKVGGALTAMGNTIKSGGQVIGKGAMKGVQSSEKFKQFSAEAARKKQDKMSQKTIDKLEALKAQKEANGEKLSDRDAMRLKEAHEMQTKLQMEQAMANEGAVVLSDEQIRARAVSAKDAQELKLQMDSYNGWGPAQMGKELQGAYTAYQNNKTEANGRRLRAAAIKADSAGYYKELLNVLDGKDAATGTQSLEDSGGRQLSQLGFKVEEVGADGRMTEDTKIANTLAGLNNEVVSQYGKQLGKNTGNELSLNQFATNTGEGGLKKAIEGKGPDYLNKANDDTFSYLSRVSKQAGQNVVDTETLLHASASTTSPKVDTPISEMFANMVEKKEGPTPNSVSYSLKGPEPERIGLTGKVLAGQTGTSLNNFADMVKGAGRGSKMHTEFMNAANAIANDPSLSTNLSKEQKKVFNEVCEHLGENKIFHTGGHTPTFEGGDGI